MERPWVHYANPCFLEGLAPLQLDPERIPNLDDANRLLTSRAGFRAKAVSGYLPSFFFFECLRRPEFPTTITIRDASVLDYLPEPDIFHDVAGHVPLHTNVPFAERASNRKLCEIVEGHA